MRSSCPFLLCELPCEFVLARGNTIPTEKARYYSHHGVLRGERSGLQVFLNDLSFRHHTGNDERHSSSSEIPDPRLGGVQGTPGRTGKLPTRDRNRDGWKKRIYLFRKRRPERLVLSGRILVGIEKRGSRQHGVQPAKEEQGPS